ncbi:glycosyltransferase family 2 protein [Parabacteroides faecis]|uniref:glycosyltransferase family 2 protein n=1 Tax=Parabacteroides TaxID=375288 RepID=UPI000EFE670D|nr:MULTISPECIES: glycosyltransferase family 2 protein [Parabacteroides]MBC8616733.1 glycosyltransferase family 2 protein [Parabacteroides faecis]RHR98142.1 glycosyltransferase [Parabacteroides sp. AF14-59]
MKEITYVHESMAPNDQLFSILIPTWNNLAYLKLCLKSIEKNSTYRHQILIYVNEGSDGTTDWLETQNYEYIHNKENVGVCWALNSLRAKVKTDYILYMNDDMYACPDWDKFLWEEIQQLPDNKFFLSATLIQPRPFFCKSVIAPANFGENVETFKEQELLDKYQLLPHSDWFGSTWPPNVVHKDIWDLVGGYSIEFSPGMYSDPDFSAKLWMAGIRLFKGLSASRVYHFESVSTGRVKKNNGSQQFLSKWGITSASFIRNILRRGEPFEPKLVGKPHIISLQKDIFRSRLKKALSAFKDNGHAKKLWK